MRLHLRLLLDTIKHPIPEPIVIHDDDDEDQNDNDSWSLHRPRNNPLSRNGLFQDVEYDDVHAVLLQDLEILQNDTRQFRLQLEDDVTQFSGYKYVMLSP